MDKNTPYPILNVGTGRDIEIKNLALIIQSVIGHEGEIFWDVNMPDGTPRKVMDISRMRELGWEPRVSLTEGISKTYTWYLQNTSNLKMVNMHI